MPRGAAACGDIGGRVEWCVLRLHGCTSSACLSCKQVVGKSFIHFPGGGAGWMISRGGIACHAHRLASHISVPPITMSHVGHWQSQYWCWGVCALGAALAIAGRASRCGTGPPTVVHAQRWKLTCRTNLSVLKSASTSPPGQSRCVQASRTACDVQCDVQHVACCVCVTQHAACNVQLATCCSTKVFTRRQAC